MTMFKYIRSKVLASLAPPCRAWVWGMLLLCLFSCKEKTDSFVLEGNVLKLSGDTIWHADSVYTDTLYIYGADALYAHIDTVVATNGAFRHTMDVDTVVPLWVLFPNNHREMLFADRGVTATMRGDTAAAGHIRIEGGEQNTLLQQFYHLIDSLETSREIAAVADSFIRANPYSEVSIYLLREYFINKPTIDPTKIKTLIGSMSGNLQDNNYIRTLQHTLNGYKPMVANNVVTNYNVRDREGKNVSTADYTDTYLLITFWASWDQESRQRQRELVGIKEKYAKHNFDILSVSLDTDRQAWLQAIESDSLTWRQACDLDGWKTGIVERMHIDHLPANMLLNPSRRIQAIDLYGEALDKKIGELTHEKKPEKKKKKSPQSIRELKKK